MILSSRYTKTLSAVVVTAVGYAACDAFAPRQHLDTISRSQDNLLSTNAIFDLFKTGDEKAEISTGMNSNVFGSLPFSNSNILLEKAKDFINYKSGYYSDYDADVYADDFVFRGPIIGPLNREDHFGTMDAFKIYKSIPDIKPNAWGFSIDPVDPNRVWFMVRQTGTFTGDPLLPDIFNIQPTGAKLEGCPETYSLVFNEEQKVKLFTAGYVADRFDGNTDGIGAGYGIFKVIGLQLPNSGPLLETLQWSGRFFPNLYPKAYSLDVPEWYLEEKGTLKGVQGVK